MISKAMVTSCLACILGSAPLAFAGPPVKIEVVVEDEDDFFENKKKAAPKTEVEKVREHADEMFDDLAKEEAKHKNDNTNVVNVVVVDGEKTANQVETPSTPDVPLVTVDPNRRLTRAEKRLLKQQIRMARLRERQQRRLDKLRIREEKLRLRHQELAMREDLRCQTYQHVGWWNRASHARQGDFLLHGIGSFNGQGVYGGFGGEWMTTDVLGLRAQAQFMGVRHDDSPHSTGPNFNFSNGGTWANPNSIDYRELRSGHAHLIDASLAVHIIPRSRFDIYPTAGISYMGYGFDYGDREEKGGAGYFRLGAGFNIVIKRFYGGMEFGWYPVELFHHGTGPNAQARQALFPEPEGGNNNQNPRDNDDDDDGPSRFNAKRMTLTAHVGLRF